MTHSYKISGMTCNNCVAKVKSELLKTGDVLSADVKLEFPQAIVEMQKHIPLKVLQDAVSRAGKYSIESAENQPKNSLSAENITEEKSFLHTYKPIFLIFIFITAISFFTSFQNNIFLWQNWMNNFMAGFFLTFSFFKLLDIKGFADSYSSYDLLGKKWYGYGFIYPFIELLLGVAYLMHWQFFYTNIATIIVMGFSSIGVIRAVADGQKIQCACLGSVFKLPMSTVTIIEDVLMVAMAIFLLI